MRRESIAVVGAGVAGLGAAWTLRERSDVHVFERADYAGGHTHTVSVSAGGRTLPVDTGFIVYNESTYPLLTALFDELAVETRPTNMSFSVDCRRCGWLYSGLGPLGVFARPGRALTPRFLRFLLDIQRFNRTFRGEGEASHRPTGEVSHDPMKDGRPRGGARADRHVRSGRADPAGTIEALLARSAYGDDLGRHYLLPLASALWSTGVPEIREFPACTLISFFRAHRLFQIRKRLRWRTVDGGSRRYVDAMLDGLDGRVHLSSGVRGIRREGGRLRIRFEGGSAQTFDRVIVATHADQALALLENPTGRERELLSAWGYNESETVLHSDDSVLAGPPAARASWNYQLEDCRDPGAGPTMTYNLSRLQGLGDDPGFYVTLNPARSLERVHLTRRYRHPVFTMDAVEAQPAISELGDETGTYFAGAYLGYGFHEDGLRSGIEAARRILEGGRRGIAA